MTNKYSLSPSVSYKAISFRVSLLSRMLSTIFSLQISSELRGITYMLILGFRRNLRLKSRLFIDFWQYGHGWITSDYWLDGWSKKVRNLLIWQLRS
jgi:hypothetical protein